MPLATITQTTLAAGFTQVSLDAYIQSELVAAGFTQVFSITGASGQLIKVYSYTHNASTYGTIYLRTEITTSGIGVTFGIAPAYNNTTGAIVNGYNGTNQNFVSSTAITGYRVVHPEMRFLNIGSLAIGYVRPATQYSWWSDNNFPFFFSSLYQSYMTRFNSCALAPMGSQQCFHSPILSAAPPGGMPQMRRAPFIAGSGATGYAWGQFSRDIASVPALSGVVMGNTFEDGAEVFTVVLLDSTTAAIAIRTA